MTRSTLVGLWAAGLLLGISIGWLGAIYLVKGSC